MNLDSSLLEAQWRAELLHQERGLDLSAIAFAEADWTDLNWNAREVLHLNDRWPRYPAWLRGFLVAQDAVNIHLIRAFQKLLGAWQQWTHFPYVKSIASLPAPPESAFLLSQAWSRLDRAQEKYDSLMVGEKFLHQFSLRQWRLLQQLAALLSDLNPLVQGTATYLKRDKLSLDSVARLEEDILWHTRELQLHLGRLDYSPGLGKRLRAPRLEVNRMLALNCLFHSKFLKDYT